MLRVRQPLEDSVWWYKGRLAVPGGGFGRQYKLRG